MDSLIEAISEKTGLPAEQARAAANAAISFLKDKLPDPIAGMLDNLVGGGDDNQEAESNAEGEEGGGGGGIMGTLKGLGGLLGGN